MIKILGLLAVFLLLFSFSGFSQDVSKVIVHPKTNQSSEQQTKDKNKCYAYTDNIYNKQEHKTIKNTGAGAGIGGVVGGILGHGGVGAVAGGAAGAYRGHKKSQKDKIEFNETYVSCLRGKRLFC